MSLWIPQGTAGNKQLRKVTMILQNKTLNLGIKKGKTKDMSALINIV